jgi:hypothetical protein
MRNSAAAKCAVATRGPSLPRDFHTAWALKNHRLDAQVVIAVLEAKDLIIRNGFSQFLERQRDYLEQSTTAQADHSPRIVLHTSLIVHGRKRAKIAIFGDLEFVENLVVSLPVIAVDFDKVMQFTLSATLRSDSALTGRSTAVYAAHKCWWSIHGFRGTTFCVASKRCREHLH